MEESCKKLWVIPDCFCPECSTPEPYISHEAICVLNRTAQNARISLTLYFEDAEPVEGFTAGCEARRTNHIRLDKLLDKTGKGITKGMPYAIVLESDVPVTCQYTRVDTTQERLAIATTMAL